MASITRMAARCCWTRCTYTAFEVEGDHVAVRRVDLDWQTDGCAGQAQARLKLDSRYALPAATLTWYVVAPDGQSLSTPQTMTVNLPAGVSWYTLPSTAFAGNQAGTHAFVIELSQAGRQMARATQAFDVDEPALLGLALASAYYCPTWPVSGSLALLNDSGQPISLSLAVDGQLAEQRVLSDSGYVIAPFSLGPLPAGTHTLSATLVGDHGCASQAKANVLVIAAPQVRIVSMPPTGLDGWHIASPTLYLRSDESWSPLTAYYAWDGGEAIRYNGSGLTLPADGQHELTAWGVADDASASPVVTTSLWLDRQAPQVSATLAGQTPVTVTLIASDTTSGVGWIGYQVDGGDWLTYTAPLTFTPATTISLSYRARDVAGNGSDTENIRVAPAPTAVKLLGFDVSGWRRPGWWPGLMKRLLGC